jgi:hypothetical protein
MGFRNQWADDEHLIMDLYIEAPWTWQGFMEHVKTIFAEISATGKPCATTVDVSQIGALPKGNVLSYLSEVEKQMPRNVFASAVIGAPYMVNVFMDILLKMRPRAQRIALFTNTHQEAYAKIHERYEKMKASTDHKS